MIVNIISSCPSQYSHNTDVVNFTMLHPQKVHASFATQLHDVILRTKQGYIMMFWFLACLRIGAQSTDFIPPVYNWKASLG